MRIDCDAIVVATHVPFNDRLVPHTKQAAYRSYVIALRIGEHAVPDALLWDTRDPYSCAKPSTSCRTTATS